MDVAPLLGAGSLWAATAAPAPDLPALEGEIRCDVAVIGGGFTGLSTGLHLAERGVSVAVLEAGPIGDGASGRNGGQVIPGLKKDAAALDGIFGKGWGERLTLLADGAAQRVYDIVARYAIDCGLERNGWVRAAHAERALEDVATLGRQLQDRGQDAVMLSRAEIAAMLGTDIYVGGMHDRRAGAVQPLSYVRGLARAAASAGAKVFQNSPAVSLVAASSGWKVETARGTILAEQVVLATGAYSGRLWPALSRSFVGVQSAQLASAPLSDNLRAVVNPSRAVVSDTRKLANYFRVDATGRLIVGGRGPLSDSPAPATLEAIERAARRWFPELGQVDWRHAWCGRIDITLDSLPRVTRPAPGLWTALGYNGRGVALATTMGAVLANKLSGGDDPLLDWPETPLSTIPFHGLRAPGVAAATAWYRLRDALGFAG